MIKKFKPAILLLINLLILQGICGQTPQDMPGYLVQKFSHYCKSVPREEIFIHSDRDEYVSGEDLWFNVYLIDRQSFKPSLSSRIVYFEILNSENRPVVQKRIQINNGFGPGQIVLPDTLSSGSYTIRAYTSWMKNFLPYNCFMKAIAIYNTLNNKSFKRKLRTGIFVMDVNSKNAARQINKAGITLNTNNSKPDILEVLVTADNKYRSENKNLVFIFIQTHGNINYLSSEKVYEEETKFYIPKNMLGAGINQITLFNSKGESVGERYIYTPDIELFLSDYISLPVMSEIFFELLPGISLKEKKSTYEISMTYRIEDDQFSTIPCIMIDGVIIKDPSIIDNLDPEIVQKIDVIKGTYLVGKYFFQGIVNVITKSGDFSCVSLPDYMIRLPYKITEPVRSFVSPDYSSEKMKASRIPDYRNTLYWNTSVKPDKDGWATADFWGSDNKTDYLINVQGITMDGQIISFKKILKVK